MINVPEEDAPILIVDDHEPNLVALEVVLESVGVRIVRATSGNDALKEILRCEFALILLDVMMPELDGFETATLIRGRRRSATTPIIFVTANTPTRDQLVKGYTVGAADYLTKPIDPLVLRAKVGAFGELYRARRQIERQSAELAEARLQQERLEARADAYRYLAESIPQQVWTATREGALDYVNTVVMSYFDQPSSALLGSGWLSMLHPDDSVNAVARWTQALADGAKYEIEFRLRRHDGQFRWHLGRAVAERNRDGNVIRWFGTNTDIEDHKRAEAELRRAVKSRDDLLATVSHDLRGPLNSVLLATDLLEPSAESIARGGTIIQRSVSRMEDLIRDLLDMASIESGHLSVEARPLVIEDVVADALETIHPAAAAKVVTITTDLMTTPKAAIHGDRRRLLQVFSNILGNAVKFTPASGRVSVRAIPIEGPYIQFAIADSGPGIRQHELPFVFDRFWQAKETAKAGTGLGLAICKGIVQQHGGSIWVESQPGSGTTFYFTMPVSTADAH
ncbi:MAG: hybrid sensor histidine kinase/response regulator [Deltaproteobacteria bacterium]